jgi:hypothetical protein
MSLDPETGLPVSDTNGSHPDAVLAELYRQKDGLGADAPSPFPLLQAMVAAPANPPGATARPKR